MTNSPYTAKRANQFRGPDSSEDYNSRIEENYKDLVYLYNKTHSISGDLDTGFKTFLKELMSLSKAINNFDVRLQALESANGAISFTTEDQIETDRFNSTVYNVNVVDRCTFHSRYNILTLPLVPTSSLSKVRFTGNDGTVTIPPSLELLVSPIASSADDGTAVVDSSQPYNAILSQAGKVWERNVICSNPNVTNGAQCYLYIKIPNDLSAVANSNCIAFNPYPLKNLDILEMSYSTDVNLTLGSSGTWTVFNSGQTYYNVAGAAGNIIPGGWPADTATDSGPKKFYFDPKPITAIRIKLRQRNYFLESSKTIYSYGMSKLDVRYDKFLSTGKMLIRYNALPGSTISQVTGLTPQIWNTPEYLVNSAFSYRIIYETSFDSNVYTLTPVPFSNRVWVEVTLNAVTSGSTPALSGLILHYT